MKKWKKEEGLKPKTDKFDIKGYRHTTINDAGGLPYIHLKTYLKQ